MHVIKSPLGPNDTGEPVTNLQDALLFIFDKGLIRLEGDEFNRLVSQVKHDREAKIFLDGTMAAVRMFRAQFVSPGEIVDEPTAEALNKLLNEHGAFDAPVNPGVVGVTASVSGTIALEHGLPAAQMKLLLYQRGLGGKKTLLGEGVTDNQGGYALQYAAGAANIELYAVGEHGEVQLSLAKYGVQQQERLDLVAPSALQPAAAEFSRLMLAVAPHAEGKPEAALMDAVERGNVRDFSHLSGLSGWDAGALALAAGALDGAAKTNIPADGFYALTRAGLPTDMRLLADVPKDTVANALSKAAEAGIVDASRVDQSLHAFSEFSADYRYNNAITGAPSSPKEFVGRARIAEVDRTLFAQLIRDGQSSGGLWEQAKTSGVSEEGLQKLQLQGKLAYLTFNNVELTDFLLGQVNSDPLDLIRLGYYDTAKWTEVLKSLAGSDAEKLAGLIPSTFSGQTLDERMGAYTNELARRVRQMDTHAVTVARITSGELEGVSEREGVSTFLTNATAAKFRLGQTPLSRFVAQNEAVWHGIPAEKQEAVLSSVRTLSALYATSPSDEALSGLLQAGFTSATSIAKLSYDAFADIIGRHLPEPQIGDKKILPPQIYWKAQQQSATVFNVFDGLKRLNTVGYAPGSTPGDAKQRDDQITKTREKLAGLFPTLETLFGSVDYCECSACQSVLSPAAYLVDLLHFIDPNTEAWDSVKAAYKARTGFAYTKQKPFDVLNERRPDIQNIALTCENTNTALPYIDVVNEILEQLMMAGNAPLVLQAYDVGEVSSQDLIAEPQNILWPAYIGEPGKPGLRDLVYPISLPFDLPLEMVRACLKQLDLPLWHLRQCLARPSTLGPSASGRIDGWSDVWFERLGLGANDVSVITRSNRWHELYGYDTESAALKMETLNGVSVPAQSSLRNGKTLARRLDVTYMELVELLRTRFINPQIETLIALQQLGVDPHTVDRLLGLGSPLTLSENTDLEGELKVLGIDPRELALLRNEATRKATLVLRSPNVGCDFSKTTLAFEQDPTDPDIAMALVLHKLNAFVRLQKKLGWEIHELDRVLVAVMPGLTNLTLASWPAAMNSALIYLAHVEELRECMQGELSREEIVLFWSDIPTTGISCLYERLFLGSGAVGHDPVFKKRLGRVLEDKTVLLTNHTDNISQAFQLPHDLIEPILAAAGATDRALSIENLSTLIRHTIFARGLGVSVNDLLLLMNLSERRPLSPLEGAPLSNLAEDVPWNETLGFVREIALSVEAGVDGTFFERICRHRGVIEEPAANTDPVLLALNALPPVALPQVDPSAPEKQQALLAEALAAQLKKQQALLVQTLAAQLSATEPLVDFLLGDLLKDAANKPLKEVGFSDAARAAQSLQRLRKALDLVQSLGITEGELKYLTSLPGGLDLNDLPTAEVTNDANARDLRAKLGAWLELSAVRRQFGSSERLLKVLVSASKPITGASTALVLEQQLHDALAALTGLKAPVLAESLEALGAKYAGGPSFTIPALADSASLRRTLEALRCFTRLGLRAKDVVQVASSTVDVSSAQRLRSALKGRYVPSAWRALAKPIFDGLRRKQRDALVAHLTQVMDGDKPKYGETAEQLYEHLLLDPEMEPVVLGSRIQLAIGSAQLFVQRCLMNLENPNRPGVGVEPQIIDHKRWSWMRRYRVWEVNRKMFIWPENWLDPEFRDDKTHLFRKLEGTLLQGDVNDDLVRTSLHTYLKGLEDIARLEMLTMYFEPGASADGSIIHVVGRTPNAPYKYFYRKMSHRMWTPWEPIDVGIEGEHLVLTAWRGRMYLFWVSFLEQAEEGKGQSLPHVKLQLHWVEQTQGKWINRSSIPTFVDTEFKDASCKATTDEQKQAFFVRAVVIANEAGIEDDDLEIQITQGNKKHRFVFFSKLAPPRSESLGSALKNPPFKLATGEIGGYARATKWLGNGALEVSFVSAVTQSSQTSPVEKGGGYHKVIGGNNSFKLLFPSNQALPWPVRTPPAGVGRASGYVFQRQDAQHVTYRSGDGSIYDLFGTKNGWFFQSPSRDAATSGGAENTEPARSDPHGYALEDRGIICIAYAGSTKIHELVWSQLDSQLDDSTSLGTGWHTETLYIAKSIKDRPQGRPFGGLFLPKRGVVFKTTDGRLLRVIEGSAGVSFTLADHDIAWPLAASEPSGQLMTTTKQGVISVESRHIFYLGMDDDVHELKSDSNGQLWTHTNVTQGMSAVKPAVGANLSAFAFLAQKTLHVVYRGTDDRIHELTNAAGTWSYSPIGASFTKAKGDPVGYAAEFERVRHVVYRGEGDDIVELWCNGPWRQNILTKTVAGAQKSASEVAAYSFESAATQHVVYFTDGGSPRELMWKSYAWTSGEYELTNPFKDDLGPLASPFFYESSNKDHTFFVEPYVVETAVHEWSDYVVTTREYVGSDLGSVRLEPVFPKSLTVVPSKEGIIQKPSSALESVFSADAVIRTSKALIQPKRESNLDVTALGRATSVKELTIVDLAQGHTPGINAATIRNRLGVIQ